MSWAIRLTFHLLNWKFPLAQQGDFVGNSLSSLERSGRVALMY
jgi:hypothetical protein